MKGLVIKNTGSGYQVRTEEGEVFDCKIKGNFRIKGIKSTNPIAVGDWVEFNEAGLIHHIQDRTNYVVRKPANLSKQLHVIAANVDQVLLVVTLKNPETPLAFIDRFIASTEAYRIPTIIAVNKVDLLDEYDQEYLQAFLNLYTSIGYPCVPTSFTLQNGTDQLIQLLQGKTTLLSGNSGVGKSTLINHLVPDAQARVSDISTSHQKGMHTTTFSEMYDINAETHLIDTPGIKGFGLIDMDQWEVSHYFKEIFKQGANCRFDNCTHRTEPGCAVREAVENHFIAQSRYQSYLGILEDINGGKYR
ncbi:MAG: ribosome small subunit-dependent GTPase A [Paludibacteraceae bacterium]|nr:ribosome small subunit-dependent GTPase A [Paludibacteraceae bacterium]